MTARPLRFFHRGRIVTVEGVHPTRSVLNWLREDARCAGTKEGCNEGDCGACTVVVGELAEAGDPSAVRGLLLRTVNACIQFLPTLDGKALFTVEDLKAIAARAAADRPRQGGCGDGSMHPETHDAADAHASIPAVQAEPLHPVQQALVECHGSQCGFCTPGFVMSLWSAYERCNAAGGQPPSRQQLADELSGNLCRCTGYRPILDAGQRMFDLDAAPLDTAPAVAALQALRDETGDATFHYAAPNPAVPTPAVAAASADGGATITAIAPAASRLDHYHAPRTLDALAALRLEKPTARIVAGATDVGLWVNKLFRDVGDVIHVGDVAALKRIDEDATDGSLVIGAGASLEAAWRALVRRTPTLEDVWLRFASPPIRNAGTMGGNVANGSPIGDAPPALMALGAQIELRRGERLRAMPLEDFYLDYMKNRLEPGEFMQSLRVPKPDPAAQVRVYKISKRFDCDISAVCAGLSITLDGAGTVADVCLAWGGMAATVRRAATAEAALLGKPWDEATLVAAQQALATDFKPLTDMRASAAHRMQVAQNLLRRFWLETRPDAPLAAQALSVWTVMPHAAV